MLDCPRCDGQVFVEPDLDLFCLQCGYTPAPANAIALIEERNRETASTGARTKYSPAWVKSHYHTRHGHCRNSRN